MTNANAKPLKAKLSIGGIHTNIDTDVDAATRDEGEKMDYRLGVVGDAFTEAKEAAKSNPHGNAFRVINPGDNSFSTPEHIAEKGFKAADRPFAAPTGFTPNPNMPRGFNWVMTETDQGAVLGGHYCENCLQLQKNPNTYLVHGNCEWAVGAKSMAKGCGWNALLKIENGGNRV